MPKPTVSFMPVEKLDYDAFVELIRDHMKEDGVTQAQLAEYLGLSQAMVSIFINGKRRLGDQHLDNIIDFFELSVDDVPQTTEPKVKPDGNKIFISYSHKDKEFLNRLMVHLKPLERTGEIEAWADTKIKAGDDWENEIETALNAAKIAVLLVSADFLASDFIVNDELPPLLEGAKSKGTLILPVILKPCRFTREKNLKGFQSINPPDEPVGLSDEIERELIYDTIAQRIEDALAT